MSVASGSALSTQSLPESVVIREVGPRDGLQAEAPVPPASRARMIQALLDAGVRHIEAVSFVSPRAVPAMADPEEVLASISRPSGVVVAALVPNLVGAERALNAGVDEITATVAASAEYNRRNVKMSIEDSVKQIEQVCELASSASTRVDAVISCAFGSPYEGDIPAEQVAGLAGRLLEVGVSAITLADTTGMATPRVLGAVLDAVRELAELDLGLHMHETRGTGLLNCFIAMGQDVSRFDASVGGLGGSPFADGAAGNVATEDLVALLDDLGVRSGIDIGRLLRASAVAEEVVGHRLQSRVAYAGPRLAGR